MITPIIYIRLWISDEQHSFVGGRSTVTSLVEFSNFVLSEMVDALHEVIQQAWTIETLPRSWTEGVLCPVYKKSDKLDCKNYRGICLLNVTYKVSAKIIYDRLLPHANTAVQHYQAEFQSGKSTTNQLFALRQILEKCNEFNITTHHQFIDFKAAYDIIRNEVYVSMSAGMLGFIKRISFDILCRSPPISLICCVLRGGMLD
jgi:hypothetical protein